MLDLKWIRENPEAFDAAMARRGLPPQSDRLLGLDKARREVQTELQELQARRNAAAKEIGKAKASGGDADALIREVADLKGTAQELEARERDLQDELDTALSVLPNILADDVPDGASEDENVELRRVGDIPTFDFKPKEHYELGEALGLMDFETAAKISGSRFVVTSGQIARLERALAAFMIDVHTLEKGYLEVSPPVMVRGDSLFGTGQLPKFEEDLYKTGEGHYMIPTAEVPLTNLVRDSILSEDDLPKRFTAHTLCFRSEAGSAGKDTAGMLRQHQFAKVEMVSITTPEQSAKEHERMTACAEDILKRLELPYRVVVLCSGDTGFGARKTYDIEVWLPGQDSYREISSCSNCGDFQARRMKGRYRPEGEKGTQFVHTLNGSGLAVGRTLIAVMENYQQADGSIKIPDILVPYMGGVTEIRAEKEE
ncbi:serine--tRNA ligase [uncultured Sneathiella sp.]|jgi:seryl-tRNA synthetase|uniref:serine--tRNA ligase n=1 Tax=uncultured Sneathiella sp. TaxID=879315 RepID=UPI0030DDDA01|tara:strand:- start:5905 stop:7188 length:1284 start_codon:yes stop_codon:yes gene_type:complete